MKIASIIEQMIEIIDRDGFSDSNRGVNFSCRLHCGNSVLYIFNNNWRCQNIKLCNLCTKRLIAKMVRKETKTGKKGRRVKPMKIAALVVSAIQDLRETKGSTPKKIAGYISYTSSMPEQRVKRQVSIARVLFLDKISIKFQ